MKEEIECLGKKVKVSLCLFKQHAMENGTGKAQSVQQRTTIWKAEGSEFECR
jgi:hypothetical protein